MSKKPWSTKKKSGYRPVYYSRHYGIFSNPLTLKSSKSTIKVYTAANYTVKLVPCYANATLSSEFRANPLACETKSPIK